MCVLYVLPFSRPASNRMGDEAMCVCPSVCPHNGGGEKKMASFTFHSRGIVVEPLHALYRNDRQTVIVQIFR